VGYWGFTVPSSSPLKILTGIGITLAIAAVWGAFRVPGDGGDPVVEVNGIVRLGIEFCVFAIATAALATATSQRLAWLFALIVLAHYAVGFKRVIALIVRL
jgi:hypothetical protein